MTPPNRELAFRSFPLVHRLANYCCALRFSNQTCSLSQAEVTAGCATSLFGHFPITFIFLSIIGRLGGRSLPARALPERGGPDRALLSDKDARGVNPVRERSWRKRPGGCGMDRR